MLKLITTLLIFLSYTQCDEYNISVKLNSSRKNDMDRKMKVDFSRFVSKFRRNYRDSYEYSRRFSIFKETYEAIQVANSKRRTSESAYYAINKFSDWTQAELDRLTGFIPARDEDEDENDTNSTPIGLA